MNAHPGPMVSGSHFFPAAPLLCTKLMPACLVMSRKRTCALATQTNAVQISSGGRKQETRLVEVMVRFIGPGSHSVWQPLALPVPAAPKHVRVSTGVRCCLRDAAGDTGR